MKRFRVSLPLVAALIGAVMFGAPNPARAAYDVHVYDDGVLQGGITVFTSGNNLVFFGSTTHFSITNGSGLSNNPGAASSNLALSTNEQISSTFGASGGSHTIRIELSQNGWSSPTGTPLNLSSSAGGSFDYLQGSNQSATQSVKATYQGFLDNTNALFGQPGAGSTPPQTASASRTTVGTSPLVFSPGTSVNLVPGGTPFSMTDALEFTFTVSAGSGQTTANVSASTVATAVPAPAGLVLALTATPFLGIGTWLRRRRQAV